MELSIERNKNNEKINANVLIRLKILDAFN